MIREDKHQFFGFADAQEGEPLERGRPGALHSNGEGLEG